MFVDQAVLASCSPEALLGAEPFPWWNPAGALTDEAHRRLSADWPDLSLFERHQGLARPDGQRPHDRYYLAFESSLYRPGCGPGVARDVDLPVVWRDFIVELREDVGYRDFVERFLGRPEGYRVRFAWHIGTTGSEVSPHRDAPVKLGTHIWYFNPAGSWDPEWGGATLLLGCRTTEALNPEFEDFGTVTAAEMVGNRSLLFRNGPDAWHGARALERAGRDATAPLQRHLRAARRGATPVAACGRKAAQAVAPVTAPTGGPRSRGRGDGRSVTRSPHGRTRVLHVHKVSGIGGAERHLLDLLPALARAGVEVHVCSLTADGAAPFLRRLREAGVVPVTVRAGPDLNPWAMAQVARRVRTIRPHVVHTHLVHGDLHGQPVARALGIPAVSSVHGTPAFYRRRLLRQAGRMVGSLATRRIAVSEHVRRFLLELGLGTEDRITVIPYGLRGWTNGGTAEAAGMPPAGAGDRAGRDRRRHRRSARRGQGAPGALGRHGRGPDAGARVAPAGGRRWPPAWRLGA